MVKKNTITNEIRNNKSARAGLLRLLCCFVLGLLICTQTAAAAASAHEPAVDPVGHSENYSAVLYDNRNGLPISEANDIAQTSEGFIWIASYAGLIRYDGNTFERRDTMPALKSVACVYVDSKDRLWVGSNDNGVAVLASGVVHTWDEESGLSSDKIRGFAEDAKGTVYIGATGGVCMVTPDYKIRRLTDARIEKAMIERVYTAADGTVCCTTSDMNWFSLKDGEVTDYVKMSDIAVENISCIVPDPEDAGKVMIGTEDCGFYRGDIHGSREDFEYVDTTPLFGAQEIMVCGDQTWICARNGIGVIDKDGFHYLDSLPMDNSVSHMMVDYEGNMWFSSTRQGIMKIVPNRFTDVFALCGLEERVVNTTCLSGGTLFIGADTGLTVVKEGKPLDSYPLDSVRKANGDGAAGSDLIAMLDGCRIRSVIEDSSGRLWISTWGTLGLLCLDKGDLTIYDESTGLVSNYVRAVCEDGNGSMLAVCTGGLSVIEGGRVIKTYGKDEGITNTECLCAETAPNGDILVGSNGDGIYIINEEGVRSVNKKDGLLSNVIMRVKYDPERKLYWIVAGNSIAYMTEKYKITTVKTFPFSDNFDLFENKSGDMWVISGDGIYVMPVKELVDNKEINSVHYGLANGMKSEATSNAYNFLAENGDLYISGRTGVTKVNIDEPLEIIDNLKMAVPFIDADGDRLYPDKNGSFTIPANTKRLTIHPYVFNYSLTDPKVSVQLKGFDTFASTLNRSELGPVLYTNLPGKKYTFDLQLMDAMGHASKTLPVTINKQKAFFEQTWFYVMGAIAFGILLAAVIHRYIGKRMSALEEKHREETERERVNNELHMANRIQTGMLPHEFPPFPERREFDIYASMDPAKEVGGDFYDFFFIDEDRLCLVMADVSGKGIPAAMFMMNSKVRLQGLASSGMSPAEILTKANEDLCKNNETEMFVTVWLGILDLPTGHLIASNAGHEYPVLRRAGGRYEIFRDRHGLVVGGMEGVGYRDYEIDMYPGDCLFVYTDGVPEATNSSNEMFGTDRMLDALNEEPDADPEKLLVNVRSAIDSFVKDVEQFDDLTMLCIRYNGGSVSLRHKPGKKK